ncbi:hypothetical protein A2U01_0083245, partial [Trifolium medium]|nr:hypothetical protein [Trifolium medium]
CCDGSRGGGTDGAAAAATLRAIAKQRNNCDAQQSSVEL